MRAHYYRPIQDNTGALEANVQITLYDAGTTDLITDVIYADDTSSTILSNPYISNNGIIDFYFDVPRRVRIALVQGENPVDYIEDQDVLSVGSDSPHVGAGSNSTQVGVNGGSTGTNASAFGYNAQASGTQGTAVGSSATASSTQATSLGSGSLASGVGTTTLGNSTSAGGANSTAVGNNANARTDNHSTALGADAETDDDNQIMLGTSADTVVVTGTFVLVAPNGSRWSVTVDNDGVLTTTVM